MGPNDPFSSRTRPAAPSASAGTPPAAAPPAGTASGPDPRGRMRVEARLPDRPRPARSSNRAALAGAAGGLVLGLLVVLLGVGPALVVAVCAGVGAALGAVVHSLFSGGVDVGAAWHALRRR